MTTQTLNNVHNPLRKMSNHIV